MTSEGVANLKKNIVVGFTSKRGNAWWNDGSQEAIASHYADAVPVERVRELFDFQIVDRPILIPTGTTETVYRQEKTEKGGIRYVPEERLVMLEVSDRKAMVREDNNRVFGVFKSGFQGHGYQEWLINNVETLLNDELAIGSAGILAFGGRAFVSVEVPENVETPEGLTFRPNLLAVTSFDGTIATTYKRIVTVVVCDNTLSAGLSEDGQEIKIRHSKYSNLRIGEAREALAIVADTADQFKVEVARLANWKVSNRDFDLLLDAVLPVSEEGLSKKATTMNTNRRESILSLYRNDERASQWNGTALGVLQAFNTDRQQNGIIRSKTNRLEKKMVETINGNSAMADSAILDTLAKVTASV